MAKRRMFEVEVIESDNFLELPVSAQAMYIHLNMWTDDDGFVTNPKRILRMINFPETDMKLLISSGFVIPFDSGAIVITHFNQNNTLRKNRKKETLHKKEKKMLFLDENKVWCKNDLYYFSKK